MKAKSFFIKVIGLSLTIILTIVLFNVVIDIYGLFRDSKGKHIKIYTEERTAKYLLSFNYIPQNFEGIIVGPSLSDNLNTEKISEFKIYNASMMAANISELNYLIRNIVEKGEVKFVIFCIDPYITKDHGKKSAAIDPKHYYGALGSTTLLKTYLFKIIRDWEIFPSKFPKNYISSYGYYDYNKEFDEGNSKEKIMLKADEQPSTIYVDPQALNELESILKFLRKNNVQVVGYFTPVPYQIWTKNQEEYKKYQLEIQNIFSEDDILLDFNKEEYKSVTSNYNTFIDHGHLSEQGQAFILNHLTHTLRNEIKK